jgi:hypothetical protein
MTRIDATKGCVRYFIDILSINRPIKRGKEKSPSDGHCQCQKEIDDHLLAGQHSLTESHIVTHRISIPAYAIEQQ